MTKSKKIVCILSALLVGLVAVIMPFVLKPKQNTFANSVSNGTFTGSYFSTGMTYNYYHDINEGDQSFDMNIVRDIYDWETYTDLLFLYQPYFSNVDTQYIFSPYNNDLGVNLKVNLSLKDLLLENYIYQYYDYSGGAYRMVYNNSFNINVEDITDCYETLTALPMPYTFGTYLATDVNSVVYNDSLSSSNSNGYDKYYFNFGHYSDMDYNEIYFFVDRIGSEISQTELFQSLRGMWNNFSGVSYYNSYNAPQYFTDSCLNVELNGSSVINSTNTIEYILPNINNTDMSNYINVIDYFTDTGLHFYILYGVWDSANGADTSALFKDYTTYYFSQNYNGTQEQIYNNGYNAGYDTGYDAGVDDADDIGYQRGYDEGYSAGDIAGYQTGLDRGNSIGYNAGFNAGVISANDYSFLGLIGATIDAPITALTGLLNFEILGVNLSAFFFGLLTITFIIVVIRVIKGG